MGGGESFQRKPRISGFSGWSERRCSHLCHPVAVRLGGNFAGLDLAATAPEDICVADWDADRSEMGIDRGLVREDPVLLGPVTDGHDIHVVEVGAAFAPVTMGEDVVPADFAAGLDLTAGR